MYKLNKVKKKKIILILITISLAVLIVGGFFYFKSKQKNVLIYEKNSTGEDLNQKIESSNNDVVEESKNNELPETTVTKDNSAITDKTEEKVVENNPKEVPAENLKIEEQEKAKENNLNIKDRLVSWGFSSSKGRKIDTIILHSSYNVLGGDEYNFDKIIQEYKDYGVAPHYIIDRKGNIFRLVNDKNIAYHAGESQVPDGRTGVNDFSIGIELINNLEDKFTANQYEAVNDLISYLKDEYKIKYVLGHSDIAPGRKTDPWNINWEKIKK
ncbi:MAG: N-acetylmuramyl-L-alanine amidase, negative regulator of AmpC, AmpD [Candidatus Moranbacteria bacterium GW2011_GWE1_35_17]|nr:MAG: N-acetylmuramyl-L-alanine amidase, negative regulator of AmpC, AmpD [Candidatus Moranbacteria bacterium GW2011_GWE1_35_17]KKP71502.1 MAG: N-acetylmuramyl-L-alanine amidase, negative regulator of AmpC, AmpD [Candidatus Moranbacteria bacterium GW2011_GWE2_35_164]KKP84568.1 MAG: N-acetylmuramyl-L-alanine amidase, negative regulator of AmpC, AmpD [Candidatus Moranbacteria bacterium GW2011_GWF2_35_54]KKP84600.1 MAG: N-acetylmuramyl-L-alanine amidase, negative regulator of AmpC, AmpD [Candidat